MAALFGEFTLSMIVHRLLSCGCTATGGIISAASLTHAFLPLVVCNVCAAVDAPTVLDRMFCTPSPPKSRLVPHGPIAGHHVFLHSVCRDPMRSSICWVPTHPAKFGRLQSWNGTTVFLRPLRLVAGAGGCIQGLWCPSTCAARCRGHNVSHTQNVTTHAQNIHHNKEALQHV